MRPKIEEFMIFEQDNGETGIILKSDNEYYQWWKCFKGIGGQVFNEDITDKNYTNITKLYKCKYESDNSNQYYTYKFMIGKDLDSFVCVYDKNNIVKVKVKCRKKFE